MTEKDTLSRLAAVLATVTGKEMAAIEAAPEALTVEELVNDSLEWLEAVIAIEEEFDLEINDDEVDRLAARKVTVRGMVDYINHRKGLNDGKEESGRGEGAADRGE